MKNNVIILFNTGGYLYMINLDEKKAKEWLEFIVSEINSEKNKNERYEILFDEEITEYGSDKKIYLQNFDENNKIQEKIFVGEKRPGENNYSLVRDFRDYIGLQNLVKKGFMSNDVLKKIKAKIYEKNSGAEII